MTIEQQLDFYEQLTNKSVNADALTDGELGFVTGQILKIISRLKKAKVDWTRHVFTYQQLSKYVISQYKLVNRKIGMDDTYFNTLLVCFTLFIEKHISERVSDEVQFGIILGTCFNMENVKLMEYMKNQQGEEDERKNQVMDNK